MMNDDLLILLIIGYAIDTITTLAIYRMLDYAVLKDMVIIKTIINPPILCMAFYLGVPFELKNIYPIEIIVFFISVVLGLIRYKVKRRTKES